MQYLIYNIVLFFIIFCGQISASQKVIGIYEKYPFADPECSRATFTILKDKYEVEIVQHDDLTAEKLKQLDCIVFPGGLGDSDQFDDFLIDKIEIIQKFVAKGGKYVGICMGAFFAGKHYFNILNDIDAVQYVKRPYANVTTEKQTVTNCFWLGKETIMYFFDGAAFIGNINERNVIGRYQNGDVCAYIQNYKKGIVGVIGPHPESRRYWYEEIKLTKYWHKGEHHKMLLDFFEKVFAK